MTAAPQRPGMADRSSWSGFLRRAARVAGRKYARARREYEAGQQESTARDLPTDEHGDARVVCRRYAERRAVGIDADGRPECFESDHPDCEGCARDVREGRIETW